jgi:hypothetical protein
VGSLVMEIALDMSPRRDWVARADLRDSCPANGHAFAAECEGSR